MSLLALSVATLLLDSPLRPAPLTFEGRRKIREGSLVVWSWLISVALYVYFFGLIPLTLIPLERAEFFPADEEQIG